MYSSNHEQNQCCSTSQHSLRSPDPPDQSCTADLSLFSLFILNASASTHSPPLLLLPLSSLLLFLSPCLPALLTLFFLLCHCSSAWRWADAGVVRGNTPRAQRLGKHANLPFLLFQLFLIIKKLNSASRLFFFM